LFFQAWYDHLVALDVGERIAPSAGIQQLTIGIVQCVVE